MTDFRTLALVTNSDGESDGDIPFKAADPVVEGDEGDEEEGEDEYVIEVIEDHTWDDETGVRAMSRLCN